MESLNRHLVREDAGLIMLLTPPFDRTPNDPGYIKGYVPGIRENGGQYTHAAAWVVMAVAKSGSGDEAVELFHMLNPVNKTRTPAGVECYKSEPYVVAADVYAHPQHAGRGGWTWYTGSAGWLYLAGLESILGLRRRGACFEIDPCIPETWREYTIDWRFGASTYQITVLNPQQQCRGVASAELDARRVDSRSIPLVDEGAAHTVRLVIGRAAPARERAAKTETSATANESRSHASTGNDKTAARNML
jgi:cyclic beta-1,2-glucan synthetase